MPGFVHSHGVTLHTTVLNGEKTTPLVFSNSLGTDFRIWNGLLDRLPSSIPTVRYDKRGHGLSDNPDRAWGMAEHVGDLAAILDHHHISGAVICGLSVGGLIAQGLAAERPDLVRALILCDTAARIGTPEMWDERVATIRVGGLEALASPIMERWFTRSFRTGRPSELALWHNMLVRTPVEGYVRTCEAIRDTDFTVSTRALTVPTLVVVGDEDGATPPDLVRSTAELITGARFEVIENAGHLPCIEQPSALADLIVEFMREQDCL